MSQGTLSLTNGSKDVTGTGTAFTSDAEAGGWLIFHVGGMPFTVAVESVQSDTALTLADNFDGATTTGIGYNGVPLSALIQIPALTSIQARDAIRRMMMNDANFQQLLTGPGDVTINRPDGSTFSGPSWPKIVELLNGLDIDQITSLANQISDDAIQVAADKTAAETANSSAQTAKTSAESSAASANADKVDAANSASYANSRATAAEASAVRAEQAAETIDTSSFLRKSGNLSELVDKAASRSNLGLKSASVSDIVGAVSQSGGVPTGAIIESGSNANGKYTKFADGTMICCFTSSELVWTGNASGNIFASAAITLIFPAQFVNTPVVSPAAVWGGVVGSSAWCNIGSVTNSLVQLQLNSAQSNGNGYPSYIAVGRWV